MSEQIFISYRREDTAGTTGRLFDRLAHRFPRSRIFIDVDSIEPGESFLKDIEQAVASCDVLIAVIGRRWLFSSNREGLRAPIGQNLPGFPAEAGNLNSW
jgi:TIR domain